MRRAASPRIVAIVSMASAVPRVSLSRAAARALELGWGLRGASLTCLRDYWNAVFRVRHACGTFLLRLHTPRYHAAPAIASELEWLRALARDTSVTVASPIVARDGALVASLELPELGARDCTLLSWVEGRRLSRFGVRSYAKLGALIARLHDHSSSWRPPSSFVRPRWDAAALGRFWFAPHDDRGWRGLPRARRALFRATLERLGERERALATTHPRSFGLVHADLHRGNVLSTSRGLAPIDFDDCGFACHLYDLAIPLAHAHARAASPQGRALLAGYRAVRALDDELAAHLDAFVAARVVAVALFLRGWALEDARFEARVEPACDAAERFLRGL